MSHCRLINRKEASISLFPPNSKEVVNDSMKANKLTLKPEKMEVYVDTDEQPVLDGVTLALKDQEHCLESTPGFLTLTAGDQEGFFLA